VAAQLAGGLDHCEFAVGAGGVTAAQVATVRMQATDTSGSVQIMRQGRTEWLP
jgi:hypothetical protein